MHLLLLSLPVASAAVVAAVAAAVVVFVAASRSLLQQFLNVNYALC